MRHRFCVRSVLLVSGQLVILLTSGCTRDSGESGGAVPAAATASAPAGGTAATGSSAPELVLPETDLNDLPMTVQTKIGDARYRARQAPGDVTQVGELGALCYVHKLPRVAVFCFQRNTQLEPAVHAWWYYLGLAYERAGEPAQAIAAYEKAQAIEDYAPVGARLASLKGGAAAPAEHTPASAPATASTQPTPAADPLLDNLLRHGMDADWLVEAARLAAQSNLFPAAEKHLRDALDIDDAHVEARIELGRAYAMQGKLDEGVREIKRVLSMPAGKDNVPARVSLANILAAQKNYEQAEPLLRESLALAPQIPDIANSLAWVLATHPDAKQRKPDEAVALAEKACAATAYANHAFLDTLAVAYAAAGRFDDAKKQTGAAIRLAQAADQAGAVRVYQGRQKLYEAGKAYFETR